MIEGLPADATAGRLRATHHMMEQRLLALRTQPQLSTEEEEQELIYLISQLPGVARRALAQALAPSAADSLDPQVAQRFSNPLHDGLFAIEGLQRKQQELTQKITVDRRAMRIVERGLASRSNPPGPDRLAALQANLADEQEGLAERQAKLGEIRTKLAELRRKLRSELKPADRKWLRDPAAYWRERPSSTSSPSAPTQPSPPVAGKRSSRKHK